MKICDYNSSVIFTTTIFCKVDDSKSQTLKITRTQTRKVSYYLLWLRFPGSYFQFRRPISNFPKFDNFMHNKSILFFPLFQRLLQHFFTFGLSSISLFLSLLLFGSSFLFFLFLRLPPLFGI